MLIPQCTRRYRQRLVDQGAGGKWESADSLPAFPHGLLPPGRFIPTAEATGLGLDVLAEGAEAEDEVRFLHGLGCQLFQGYFFSKPLPVAEFVAAINGAPLQSLIARFTQDGGRLRLAGSA
jgi:EAL domain-containing protein (putative c-di-GMP-specific phosphodiesterase class I)